MKIKGYPLMNCEKNEFFSFFSFIIDENFTSIPLSAVAKKSPTIIKIDYEIFNEFVLKFYLKKKLIFYR